ncbi:hypothetical protein CIB48_g9917 [Xylaria polymorpha]|nr:hypothetical protein CIB48_g9917 [Xylaria polymorpha]
MPHSKASSGKSSKGSRSRTQGSGQTQDRTSSFRTGNQQDVLLGIGSQFLGIDVDPSNYPKEIAVDSGNQAKENK